MRTIKELLQVLLLSIENTGYYGFGLCKEALLLFEDGQITHEEYKIIRRHFMDNRPLHGKHCNISYLTYAFWWPAWELIPRISWLEEEIYKLQTIDNDTDRKEILV